MNFHFIYSVIVYWERQFWSADFLDLLRVQKLPERKIDAINDSPIHLTMFFFFFYLSYPAFQWLQFTWFNCVHFLGESIGKIQEGVNLTQKTHPVEVFEPGAEHIVRLLTKNWVDNNSIFEDVIETRGRGEKWDYSWCSLRQQICVCRFNVMYFLH